VGKKKGVRPAPGKGALQGLTPVGKALRFRDADLASAWERDYSEAVKAAIAGDLKRLVNLLRAHRPLGDDDFDALADYLEAIVKHGHRRRDDTIHRAARLAESLLDLFRAGSPTAHVLAQLTSPASSWSARPARWSTLSGCAIS
jgi:hypothetical protein